MGIGHLNGFFQNAIIAKSATFESDIEITDSQSAFKPTIGFDGAVDVASGKSKIDLSVGFGSGEVTASAIGVDEKGYLKLDGLAELAAMFGVQEQYAPYIAVLDNVWIVADETLLDSTPYEAAPGRLGEEQLDQLAQMYEDNQFFVIDENFDDEDINGSRAKHMRVSIDESKLSAYLRAVKDASIEGLDITDEMIAEIEETNEQNGDEATLDVWVDKKSKQLAQIKLETHNEYSSNFVVTMKFSNYNQPVDVTAPEGAKTYQQVLQELEQYYPGISRSVLPSGSSI